MHRPFVRVLSAFRLPIPFASLALVSCSLLWLAAVAAAQSTPTLETFEGPAGSWQVAVAASGSGSVTQSFALAASGTASARAATSSVGSTATVGVRFSDPATSHTWSERPGTYRWQRASVYIPSTTVAQLGSSGYFSLGGFWASGTRGTSWTLRVRQGGALSVVGTRDWDGARFEFNVYEKLPLDRWVSLELGLHSQAGPGVKRAFAFLLDGQFHGWYHQGRMQNETYDSVALGILESNVSSLLEVYVDEWGVAGTGAFPTGADLRSTASVQQQDYRTLSGVQWQVDWTTWANDLVMDPTKGVYSASDRLQSGRNIDRLPDITSGWAEIEIDWTNGAPLKSPNGYFGPMVGFRKEINREQNWEVIPYGNGNGSVDLLVEAWTDSGAVIVGRWPLPAASMGGTSIPEPGDIIRVRWEQTTSTTLAIRASYYDASAVKWYTDVISVSPTITNVNGINFADGYHTASSITIDSAYYSIRRFKVGTLDTYPTATACSASISPVSLSIGANGGTGSTAVTVQDGCSWTAASNAAWIAVTSGASGVGNGSVGFSVAANTSTSPRTGTLTVAGQTFTVQQGAAAPSCSYTLSSSSLSVAAAGGTGSVGVTAPAGCAWTAVSNAAWILVTSGASGSGNGTVAFSVDANTATTGRTGTLTVAGQTFTVQQAAAAPACSYSISPTSASFGSAGGTGSTNVSTQSGCAWTAVSNAAWISVTSGSGSSGNGTVGFSVAVNTSTSSRAGTLTVAGQAFTVQQAASSSPLPALSIADASAVAGNNPLFFVVTLSAASTSTVSVYYSTASGTAINGIDYYGMSGTVTFSPGVTTQTITVWLRQGASGEYFYVNLSNPVNAEITDGQAVGTIR